MIAMLKSDLVWFKGMWQQTAVLLAFFAVVCVVFTDEPGMFVPMVCVAIPFGFMSNLFAGDETNGWQAYRLALPLSRGQVIGGRALTGLITVVGSFAASLAAYAVVVAVSAAVRGLSGADQWLSTQWVAALIGGALSSALCLVMIGILMPCVARFGFTKAVRFLPMGLMLAAVGGAAIVSQVTSASSGELLGALGAWLESVAASPSNLAAMVAMVFLVGLGIYALLCQLAARLYARREF